MKRHWILIGVGVLACAIVAGGWASYRRLQQDALELRLCRTADRLVGEYASFRDYVAKLPDDRILARLMDREVFLPQAGTYQVLVDALKREAPDRFPSAGGFAVPDPELDSARLARQMQAWAAELATRYRCPELLVPERYFQKHLATQPQLAYQAPAWDQMFAPALERNTGTAAQYREFIRHDIQVLCRSREGLAKAQRVHDYLLARCEKAGQKKNARLSCEEPARRSRTQVEDMAGIVHVNETKFREKWSVWMETTHVECDGRR